MRTPVAVLAAAGLSALGGAILGEYWLSAPEAILGAVLFGVLVGELVVVIERRPGPFGMAGASAFPPGAWIWSLWISSGHQLHYVTPAQWAGAAAAAGAGLAWTATAGRDAGRLERRRAG